MTTEGPPESSGSRRTHDREILRLAVPAFLALVAEPLFLLSDAAIVGRLGTPELAGLGVAAVILQTAIGLCVFLAYGTTAGVARHLGAGDTPRALALGVDGIWLAVIIGSAVTALGVALSDSLIGLFGAGAEVSARADEYLRIAFLGTVPLLVMLAATGVLRGLQDTRTPLIVAVAGNALNVVLNIVLVYGVGSFDGWGIAGSAVGSVIAQAASAVALVVVVVAAARRERAPLGPDLAGIRAAARSGVALFVRTLTLRAAILATAYAVTRQAVPPDGAAQIAAHQLAMTIWGFFAFVLDAIAIAAQAITGRYLGASDSASARAVTRRMTQWGLGVGVVTGLMLAGAGPFLGPLFTTDSQVLDLLVPVLLVAALAQPVAGVVFVLDGVLIGAGDGTFLAWAGAAVLVVYTPVVLIVSTRDGGLVGVWIVFVGVFMGGRFLTLMGRERTGRWMVLGPGGGSSRVAG